ncbi:hypothetical protein FDX19_21005 [Citrobacter sp. wls619]|uniref:hypothetical protein n=1 Tax=Citrobacter sp. wls619 TaxID=2576432 RepID=UPI0010CA0155|nr:hypothetical protein [Citrobacter sp. wls619]TKV06451.1 hypothetical protein FDX19_21005 [Citrobacter sp. wls619]
MTSREQFEAWCINRLISVTRMVGCDSYQSWRTRELWASWSASRASVDVEILSEPFIATKKDATNYDFYNAGIESAKRAITNAGIKVKDC